jgi:DNA-binding MarR family transcriptional regulator/ribosomal protein S18 acetylase RimI-like enzyme
MSDAVAVQRVRAFNRAVAERIGALSDGFLGRGRPMGESRVLWEIGSEVAEVRALRARLGLDSGYASRVLRSLEQQGLITLETSPEDGRVRCARLTRAGRSERSELDRRSDAVAWGFLEPLSPSQRTRLVEAMSVVERLLEASLVRLEVEDPTTAEARWCMAQYFAELNARFETGFDPARSRPADVHELAMPRGLLLLARLREQPVGCGALKFHVGAPAELKRMWVAPHVRGLGLGRRLLSALEDHARAGRASVVRLETNRALTEAIALYRVSGYREVPAFNAERYAHHWFEKPLYSPASVSSS